MASGTYNMVFKFLFFFFLVFIIRVEQVNARHDEGQQKCLECHAKQGIIKIFENDESVEAYIDAEKFKSSVHGALTCSDCHPDFSEKMHPQRRFRSKEQYKIKSALVCRRCHTYESIKTRSIHNKLLSEEKEGKSHPCTNCHSHHSVMPVGRKAFKNEGEYCLKCHRQKLSMKFRNGESISFKIEMSPLLSSVHKNLVCSDCHFGFSTLEHPQRNFRSSRDFSIAGSETCRRCHFDKYTKTMDSIHYTALSQGNLKAPVCTDCHGSHSIMHFGKERTLIAQRCQKCHSAVFNVYAKSVHGKALFDEHNKDVPVCTDCHTSHEMKDPRTLAYHEKIPDMCSNCHADETVVNKYGLSTDVVKTYLSDFHGITLSFYKKQREELDKPARLIAVCTDCHGTHNIAGARGADYAVLKANLVKRCQQCHTGAAENFPDTWLSHYKPSLHKAPLVFIINLIYSIFIPIMVVGLILQIILHIWRYAINR